MQAFHLHTNNIINHIDCQNKMIFLYKIIILLYNYLTSGVGRMNLPNMLDAKKRTKEESKILYDDYNVDEINDLGKDKNYLILTYGCQMNVHDSEYISGIIDRKSVV